MSKKKSTTSLISDLKRKTKKSYSSEEKIIGINKMKRILIFTVIISQLLLIGCENGFSCKSKNQNVSSTESTKKNIFTKNPLDDVKNAFRFNIELSDTLFLGYYNKGKIVDYKKNNEKDDCLLSVIIENEFEDGVVRKDTFSDGTLSPWFGVYASKKGLKTIKGAVLEEILTEGDDAVHIARTSQYFSLNVYVKDSLE